MIIVCFCIDFIKTDTFIHSQNFVSYKFQSSEAFKRILYQLPFTSFIGDGNNEISFALEILAKTFNLHLQFSQNFSLSISCREFSIFREVFLFVFIYGSEKLIQFPSGNVFLCLIFNQLNSCLLMFPFTLSLSD